MGQKDHSTNSNFRCYFMRKTPHQFRLTTCASVRYLLSCAVSFICPVLFASYNARCFIVSRNTLSLMIRLSTCIQTMNIILTHRLIPTCWFNIDSLSCLSKYTLTLTMNLFSSQSGLLCLILKCLCEPHRSGGLSSLVQSLGADLQHRSSLLKDQLTGRGGLSSSSSEHLAEERRMLTAGLTSSICPFLYPRSVHTIEWKGQGWFV